MSEIDGIAGEMSLVISEGASSASAEKGGKGQCSISTLLYGYKTQGSERY